MQSEFTRGGFLMPPVECRRGDPFLRLGRQGTHQRISSLGIELAKISSSR